MDVVVCDLLFILVSVQEVWKKKESQFNEKIRKEKKQKRSAWNNVKKSDTDKTKRDSETSWRY